MTSELRLSRDKLRAERLIKAFLVRFGEPHLFFACHAAFPLGITPDLLYRLWANFLHDVKGRPLNTPWEAVADLLLSGLCSEVGFELFEMDMAVRETLLDLLEDDPRFGPPRMKQLASFLRDHVDRLLQQPGNRENQDIRDFAQTQRLISLIYVDPERGARTLASELSKLVAQGDQVELVRASATAKQFSKPLANYHPLMVYARSMAEYARGDLEGAQLELAPILDEENKLPQIAGVRLGLPDEIREAFTAPAEGIKRSGRLKDLRSQRRRSVGENDTITYLVQLLNTGRVIPVVSNTVVTDDIFDIDGDGILGISPEGENPEGWSIEEQLSDAWADMIRFPLTEQHRLPRVALFDRVVNSRSNHHAKSRYLDWLKDALLVLAEDDRDVPAEYIEELRDGLEDYSFSDIAVTLGYPKPPQGMSDPLSVLARLKLSTYVTTSPFDFLERALIAEGRQPRTQICFWSGEPAAFADESHRTDYNFRPTPEEPLVYHLFGLEAYPESMVLTEDDYLDFLIQIWRDEGELGNQLLPAYVRKTLARSSILLLGFQFHTWEFSALISGIVETGYLSLREFGVAVQLDPSGRMRDTESTQRTRRYMEELVKPANIRLEWNTTGVFLQRLWEEWARERRSK